MAKIVNMEKIQSAIGYIFRSNTLAVEALESTGHARIVSGKADGHKRLALLGNAVLGLVQLDRWYRTQQSRGSILAANTGFNVLLINSYHR